MTVAQAIKYAGYLIQVIGALRKLAETEGMPPAEFNEKVSEECKRLDEFAAEVDAEINKALTDGA